MDKSIDSSASAGHLHHCEDSATGGDYDDSVVVTDLPLQTEVMRPYKSIHCSDPTAFMSGSSNSETRLSFEFVFLMTFSLGPCPVF